LPPGALIAAPVELAMVQPADRDGEAVADLATLGIRRGPATHEARLRPNKPQMVAITFQHGLLMIVTS
jgi:hypothetical protein